MKIKKLLVANRGEIAVRVIRACREQGIATVAVFSEADREALHVLMADEAYPIGPPPATESYLKIDTLVDVARRAGADAVHPGYGFLAENAGFAEIVEQCGLRWIGPQPHVMRLMGDKVSARAAMTKAGVPILPGTGFIESDRDAEEAVERIGFPIIIKASAGGGGRGMKIVESRDRLSAQLSAARSEAQAGFNNPNVYLERYIGRPRHIEVQVLGDGQGNVAHEVYGMGPTVWQIYAPDGTKVGRLQDAYQIAEQGSGFHAFGSSGFTARNVDGTVLAQERGVAGGSSVATWMFPARTGGSIVVSTDSWGCPNGRTGHSAVNVWRFAASGALTSVVDVGGTGCPASASDAFVGLSDDHDNTFVALNTGCCGSVFGLPPERVIARWVDAGGRPLTPWMDVAAAGNIEVAPLVGGGVVLRAGNWIASFASGSATPEAAPTFIPPYHHVAIVRGGRAYAVVPIVGWARDHAIELYSPAGNHCGTLEFPSGVGLYLGRDGTVISTGPNDWCTATWWPHLLR